MSSGREIDPSKTYVLEETAITKVKTIEELAEMAADAGRPREEADGDIGLDFDEALS